MKITRLIAGVLALAAAMGVHAQELPVLRIGIVTAAIGAPFFLWLLLRRSGPLDV